MRAVRKLVGAGFAAVLLVAIFVLANPAPASAADSGAEAQFVAKINGIRQSKGLAPLAVYGEVHSIARDWTDQMVANGGISHNPNLAGQVTANWTKLGENVGVGNDVDTLMAAFVNSSAHYKNITDPAFNYIGVGVSYDASGRMFTTHDFMALDDGSGGAPSSAPAPEPAPAPEQAQAPAPAPKKKAAAAPASDPAPVADAAPADPPPPPTAPATSGRVHTVLTALRAVGT